MFYHVTIHYKLGGHYTLQTRRALYITNWGAYTLQTGGPYTFHTERVLYITSWRAKYITYWEGPIHYILGGPANTLHTGRALYITYWEGPIHHILAGPYTSHTGRAQYITYWEGPIHHILGGPYIGLLHSRRVVYYISHKRRDMTESGRRQQAAPSELTLCG